MTIAGLLRGLSIKRISGPLEKDIRGIAYDSRNVKEDFLFVAVRGFSTDGHDYVGDALNRGAAGVVVERTLDLHNETTVIEVEDSRRALALLSSAFYGTPSGRLSLIGVTGTNGKTTTSYIIKSILEAWGRKTGLLGTIQYITGTKVLPAFHTTPESLDLQRYFREMADNGLDCAVVEVSSHALALKRVEGCSFKVAVFTNFSQDHMDFHGTMKEYFKAKTLLFDYLERDGCAVLNIDDPVVGSLAGKLKCRVITCGIGGEAVIRAENITDHRMRQKTSPPVGFARGERGGQTTEHRQDATEDRRQMGLSFDIQTPEGKLAVQSELIGRNNIYNILMSAGAAYAFGVSADAIVAGINKVKPVDGRFERIEEGQDFLCMVDYAHTEDSLKKLIEEARLVTKGRVITVFGCGGDRDRTKRPRMGTIAADLSDLVIITSDNPRSEEPMEIIKDIMQGIKKDNYIVEADRAKAIEKAVSAARVGDSVLVAGKGHEDYQEIKGVRYPFSDKEALKRALKNKK